MIENKQIPRGLIQVPPYDNLFPETTTRPVFINPRIFPGLNLLSHNLHAGRLPTNHPGEFPFSIHSQGNRQVIPEISSTFFIFNPNTRYCSIMFFYTNTTNVSFPLSYSAEGNIVRINYSYTDSQPWVQVNPIVITAHNAPNFVIQTPEKDEGYINPRIMELFQS